MRRSSWIFCFMLICFYAESLAQGELQGEERWLIEWNMSDNTYRSMKQRTSVDTYFQPDSILLNGKSLAVGEIHTRGKTSLTFWRKSYNVDVKKSSDCKEFGLPRMDKFYLISMSMDKYYLRNRFAFDCFDHLGIFPLYYHYTELKINGETEGIYLLVQRPADYALDDVNAKCILRRGSTDYLVKEKFSEDVDHDDKHTCRNAFKSIKSACDKLEGVALYEALKQHLDLDSYFSWLAFNYLVRNGDYTDELFYYALANEDRLDILPWDFDDILSQQPHEGMKKRNQSLDDQLIFSSEDLLDRTIARDSFLYRKYLIKAQEVLNILTTEKMQEIFDRIGEDLELYLRDWDIIEVASRDEQPPEGIQGLQKNLNGTYSYLKTRRRLMLRKIKNALKS